MSTSTATGDWRRWVVAALGALLCGVIVGTLTISNLDWAMVYHLQFAIPILLALVVAAYGGWLVQCELSTERISRIALWSILGTVVIGSFAAWEVYMHLSAARPFVEAVHELLLGGTQGAIIGGGIGYYDAQRREQHRETKGAKQAISGSIDGIAILDEDGQYTTVNQAHADAYGYEDPDDFLGESWRMCYSDEKVAEFEDQILPVLETNGEWRGETVGKRRDGSSFPQEVTLTALDDGGLVCIVRDISERREQNRKLERKTDLFEQTQRLANVGGWELDPHDGDLLWTDEVYQIYELPVDYDLEVEGVLEFFHPEDAPLLEDAVERAIEDGESYDMELRLITANDNLRWVRALGEPRQEDGETTMLRGALQDITEQTKRETQIASLHEASRQLTYANTPEEVASVTVEIASLVLDKPLSTMWFHDEETNQLQLAATTESTQEFLNGADATELPPIGEKQFGMDVFREGEMAIIEDYCTVENPAFPNLPLGTVIIVPIEGYGILELGAESIDEITETDQHQIETLALSARVALDRAQREQALAHRQEMIEGLHSATRDMVEVADTEEICELAVGAAQQILNIPNAAIWISDDAGQRLEPVAHLMESPNLVDELPVYTPETQSLSWQAFESGETNVYNDLQSEESLSNPETSIQHEIIVPLGEYGVMNFGSRGSRTFDETDIYAAELLGASIVTSLERAEREQKLETQLDRMEFFNSILRHDVLNGMTVIQGRAQFLTDELEGDQLRDAETILEWSKDTVEIVQRVRTVIDTLTGERDIQLEAIELSDVLREEVKRVQETYPEVTIETALPNSARVPANELLSDVFGNLITNAVNHNDVDGLYISVTAAEQNADNTIVVEIADNGRGVPDTIKEAIFRRDATGHANSSGSGFGLFFVDTMVENYGGDVHVEDNEAGGATFVIELPLADVITAT